MGSPSNEHDSARGGEVASTALGIVTDLVTGASVPAPVRRNALKAFDRLCSAVIDIPVAYLEGVASEKRAETEARVKIIGETAVQIAQQMQVNPEYARLAVRKFGQRVIREQVNLDMISEVAANELRKPGAPDELTPADGGQADAISDDWLNTFEKEASQKSTEEMQLLFGRILAGEIRRPTSFSVRTVKLVANLDSFPARLFKKLCSACVVLGIPTTDDVIDVRVPSLGGNAGANSLGKYGFHFDQLNMLHEYGLIIPEYNSWADYRICIANERAPGTIPFRHQGQYWALLPTSERQAGKEFKVSGIALSHSGRELMRIVDTDPMPKYTEALQGFFVENGLRMVEVGVRVTHVPGSSALAFSVVYPAKSETPQPPVSPISP